MKNILKSLIVIFFITALVSCMDNMDNDPIGLITVDQVSTDPTTETVESAVWTSYGPLKNTLNGIIPGWRWDLGTVFRNDIVLQDIASSDMNKKWNPDGDQVWMDEVGNFIFTPENQAFNGIWVYDYEGVSRSNLAIGLLTDPEITSKIGMSSDRVNQLLSEVYFLRAYYYFDLVNNFGDVPLILQSPESFEEAFEVSVRAPKEEVMAQIKLDLAIAKSIAPNVHYAPVDQWRATKGAIIALQAKVELFDDEYEMVLSLIGELEGLGFYNLNANYFDSFDVFKEYNEDEVIFSYDHQPVQIPGNGNGLGAVSGWGFWAATDDFISAFEANDPRLLYTIDVTNQRSAKILGSATDYKGNGDSPGNKVFIRYSDVLLWKAEAMNETGDYPGAINIINQIRERARNTPTLDGSVVPPGTLPDRPNSTDPSEIMDWLMSERRVELGWESQRFNDLKRWRTAESVLTALGKNFQDFNYLYPIPQRDIDKSGGSITQNPGY